MNSINLKNTEWPLEQFAFDADLRLRLPLESRMHFSKVQNSVFHFGRWKIFRFRSVTEFSKILF